jgi:hypothetical protein
MSLEITDNKLLTATRHTHGVESMKSRIMIIVGVALMLCAVALAWSPVGTLLAVDSCLDAGGSFNYAAGVCDFDHSHAYTAQGNSACFSVAAVLAVVGAAMAMSARRIS